MDPQPYELFKTLGVSTRIQIIQLLKEKGPAGAKFIAEELGITPAAASQHLKILRHMGFVNSERKGFHIPYSVNEEALGHCHHKLSEVCSCGCDGNKSFEKINCKSDIQTLKNYREYLQKELEKVNKLITDIQKKKE